MKLAVVFLAVALSSPLAEASGVCDFSSTKTLTADAKFLIKKWGKQICADIEAIGDAEQLLARYDRLVKDKKLEQVEAIAVAGYTGGLYTDLSPENIAKKPGSNGYQGFDIFNRFLLSGVRKLSALPEFQYNETVYRGANVHGTYTVSDNPIVFNRWTSSSCVKEIAFGPELIEKSAEEKAKIEAQIRAEENLGPDEEIAGLEYFFLDRDPKSIPENQTPCQKTYFDENPRPPTTPGSNFGQGNLKLTILPASGKSKRISLYTLSTRASEAEILFPPGTKFLVKKSVGPNAPGGDGSYTYVTLQEVGD